MTRPMSRILTALLALLALWVAAPAPASAASRDDIIADCADDGRLSGKYSPSELRDARKNLPSDVAEYTDCADVLRRAELALMEKKPSAGGAVTPGDTQPPASTPASDEERTALQKARLTAPAPVTVRGREIEPGSAGFTPGAVRNELPGSLLPVLFGLAMLCAAALRGFVGKGTGEAMGNDLWRPIP